MRNRILCCFAAQGHLKAIRVDLVWVGWPCVWKKWRSWRCLQNSKEKPSIKWDKLKSLSCTQVPKKYKASPGGNHGKPPTGTSADSGGGGSSDGTCSVCPTLPKSVNSQWRYPLRKILVTQRDPGCTGQVTAHSRFFKGNPKLSGSMKSPVKNTLKCNNPIITEYIRYTQASLLFRSF